MKASPRTAAAFIFQHNHSSGNPLACREDRDCTNRLVEALKILGIRVLDRIIFGKTDSYSFADAGMLSDSQPYCEPHIMVTSQQAENADASGHKSSLFAASG